MEFVNFHAGQSDKGNFNSRGSRGCITVCSSDSEKFFSNFDWNEPNTNTGNSTGSVIIYRENSKSKSSTQAKIKGRAAYTQMTPILAGRTGEREYSAQFKQRQVQVSKSK